MKFTRFFQILVAVAIFSAACDPYKIDIPDQGGGTENNGDNGNQNTNPGEDDTNTLPTVGYPKSGVAKVKTLQTSGYFRENNLKNGITHYSFSGKDDVSEAYQNINVLEVDLNNPAYKITFLMTGRTTTSAVGKAHNAIAAINAAYEQEAIYNRTNGVNHSQVTLEPDHLRFWKHEGAIVGDGKRKIGMVHGASGTKNNKEGGIQAIEVYKSLTEKNIFASSPMLIDDFDPVGTRFVPEQYTISNVSSFDSEDYRRHQGGRNPRTAVALTEDNDLLFITVDGRYSGKAVGMSCKELTNFLIKHFNPRWALNMDGGGSTTMYIKGAGGQDDVVNHPCNSGSTWDKHVQRELNTFFLIEYNE